MLASGSIRDGRPPVWVPSLKKIADFLEVPGDEFDKIFLPILDTSSKNEKDESEEIDEKNSSSPLEKKQAKTENNKKSKRSKIRTRRERVSRERM